MEIIDWEKKVTLKYNFEKTTKKDDLKKYIIGYEQNIQHFYVALKNENSLIYLKSVDDVHYAGVGVIDGDNVDFIGLFAEYLGKKGYESAILLSDLIDFLKNKGFKTIEFTKLTKEQQTIVIKNGSFTINFVTENEVTDEEFYAAYVFNDLESLNYTQTNTGFSKTFVVLGSMDNKTISSYYVMTNGKLNQKDLDEFLNVVSIVNV